jgi:ElaB/YqjD/DUF883 family membrane-anchored ribosome-binding protein
MKHNGDRRPDEILAEIDRTRGEMDRTLSAIEHRLTPGQLVDHGMDYLRHSGANEFVQNLGGAAKQNPLPVALATIGIGWLMALGRQPAQHQGYGSSMDSMKDRASGAMQSASEGMTSAKHRLSGTMSSVADTTRQQYQRARGSIDYLVNEQPLMLGAIGLAIGAALGAAAPRTRKEEELMGEASRNLTEKAKEMGSQQVEKAKEAVTQATQKVTDEVKQAQQARPQVPPTTGQPPRTQQTPTTPEKKGGW